MPKLRPIAAKNRDGSAPCEMSNDPGWVGTSANEALARPFILPEASHTGLAMSQLLIPYDSLAARGISLSKCQLWRLEKVGKFPKRVPVSAARHAWLSHEIDDWIAYRVAAREQVAA
jgi:prophage regulatory protein